MIRWNGVHGYKCGLERDPVQLLRRTMTQNGPILMRVESTLLCVFGVGPPSKLQALTNDS